MGVAPLLECVINISEGRRAEVVEVLAAVGGACVLDVHRDADHHRTVLTLAGDDSLAEAVRRVTTEAVRRIDLRDHAGAHPRLGAVDVVPFVPLEGATMADAVAARGRFVSWASSEHGLPCFLYGPERSLPEVRRRAFADLAPDAGPGHAHATAGAVCVGARPALVAYNVWLAAGVGVETAREVAAGVRGPRLRALGLDVGGQAQVSMNLLDPVHLGPAQAYDRVAARASVGRAELVGLVPAEVLAAVPHQRWAELDLASDRTIEARLDGPPSPRAKLG